MPEPLPPHHEEWVFFTMRFLRNHAGTMLRLADEIERELRGEVTPPPPDQTGTPLPRP